MKEAILEGGTPSEKSHGMDAFEYPGTDGRFNETFNKAMYNQITMGMKIILEKYKGFAGLKERMDVGGGLGATLGSIVSKYSNIQAKETNEYKSLYAHRILFMKRGFFYIISNIACLKSVPKGEVIFMKLILRDWSDEKCLMQLKNCSNALRESGKVVVKAMLPENPENAFCTDIIMLTMNPGGRERTEREFDALARWAGFDAFMIVCRAGSNWVIEFYKKI
ncbi:caffeic acid 3-O-methyltransferase-like [Actinidia eriantha]|uniref:caffeic acid 3-O-methyltransferase-like n=1 Tax=Actinidia eriantha TaxID=165200 RepID=UPI002585709F|nr:caffeic acid 3-O-methyltransferase-like [Actinidia eriantha]